MSHEPQSELEMLHEINGHEFSDWVDYESHYVQYPMPFKHCHQCVHRYRSCHCGKEQLFIPRGCDTLENYYFVERPV